MRYLQDERQPILQFQQILSSNLVSAIIHHPHNRSSHSLRFLVPASRVHDLERTSSNKPCGCRFALEVLDGRPADGLARLADSLLRRGRHVPCLISAFPKASFLTGRCSWLFTIARLVF